MIASSRNLFFLSADVFQAYTWKRGRLTAAESFHNDSRGREQLSEFLHKNRHPSYLLVDVIEEDFRHETVPHLIGAGRKELIARKFDQYYRGTTFCQARVLHRQPDGRRDDEMLFSALTNPAMINPWLETLLAHHIPVVGIYSVPNISTPLLKDIESEHVLMLSWEKGAGLRQTYFNNKRLHFSRLTPLGDSLSFSEAVTIETPRTQQYLKSLSLPPPGEVLDVYIICNTHDCRELKEQISQSSNGDMQYHFLDIQDLGKRLKLNVEFNSSDAAPLFLGLLASKPPTSHYADTAHTRYFLLWQLNLILIGLTIVWALSAAAWSGLTFMQAIDNSSDTEPLLAQTSRINHQISESQSRFPNSTVSATDMKTAVVAARKLNFYAPRPEDLLLGLSKVLDKFTRIHTNKLAWQANGAEAAPSSYPAQIITFEGELLNFGSDYRGGLAYLDRFQEALNQQGYVASLTTMPLDVSSKGSLSNSAASEKGGQFTMKIIWREKE